MSIKSQDSFYHASFTTIYTDFSEKSLRRLFGISLNERLWPIPKTLAIRASDCGSMNGVLGAGAFWRRDEAYQLREIQNHPRVKLLRLVLSLLTNCRSFCVTGVSYEEIQYLSPDEKVSIFDPNLGTISTKTYTQLSPSDAVEIILNTIEHADLKPVSFTLKLGESQIDLDRLSMESYGYTCEVNDGQKFRNTWARLEAITLENSSRSVTGCTGLECFISDFALPNLRRLSLAYNGYRSNEVEEALEAIAEGSPPQNLRHFQLSNAYLSASSLHKIVQASRQTLRTLSLKQLSLNAEEHAFHEFLVMLRMDCSCLDDLDLYLLQQNIDSRGPDPENVLFPALDHVVPHSEPLIGRLHRAIEAQGQPLCRVVPIKSCGDGSSPGKRSVIRMPCYESGIMDSVEHIWFRTAEYRGPRMGEVLDALAASLFFVSKG